MPLDDPFAPTRRAALRQLGGSVGLLGLSAFLPASGALASGTDAGLPKPHFPPKAKRLIVLFMAGGPSHLDTFDPKPAIEKYAGQRPGAVDLRTERVTGGLMPSPFRFRPGGKSGLPVSDLLPNLRDCADDLCVLRAVHAVNPNHSPAANFLATGRIDAVHPGDRGVGVLRPRVSESADLPGFVSLGTGFGQASVSSGADTCPVSFRRRRVSSRKESDPEKMIRHLKQPERWAPTDQKPAARRAPDVRTRSHAAAQRATTRSSKPACGRWRRPSGCRPPPGRRFDTRLEPPKVRDALRPRRVRPRLPARPAAGRAGGTVRATEPTAGGTTTPRSTPTCAKNATRSISPSPRC